MSLLLLTRKKSRSSPSALPNLFGWFYPDPVYCFSDNAGTVNCAPLDPIAVWKPRAGTAPNWIQTTLAKRPLLKLVNNKYVVEADGIDDQLDAASAAPWTSLAAAEIAIVHKNVGAGNKALWSFSTSGGDWWPFGTDVYDSLGSSVRRGPGAPAPAIDFLAFNVYQVMASAAAWTDWVNGIQLMTFGSNTVAWQSPPSLFVSAGAFAPRQTGEIICCSAPQSASDRTWLWKYLKGGWGTP